MQIEALPTTPLLPLAKQQLRLERYRFRLRISEKGTVVSVGDGIAWIKGLPSASMEELIELADGSLAQVFHLTRDRVGVILLKQTSHITAGTTAYLSGRLLDIGVGNALLGRVIDPLGAPLDGLPEPICDARRKLHMPSPPIIAREFVNRPLYTGNKMVDTMIPVGRGQRELLIGDNGTGKSAFAVDTLISQRGQNVWCVYVLVGQKRSSIVNTIETLREAGAMEYTAVVVAEPTAMPALKYLAPFAGCAIAEAWMWQGRDTLIVYDDMTTHARSYRELSLLLRRPPGREAYPGDIFYLHARLLERATCLAANGGGGSMTALPIIETEQGDIASFIPTNLISITDGQIYFDQRLFAGGFLPAIDVTKSVSRIGGKAQPPGIKTEAGRMKLDYLQFLELEWFTRVGSKLEASMEAKIQRGKLLREILKQERLQPLPAAVQMAWLVAYNESLLGGDEPTTIREKMEKLRQGVVRSGLSVEDSHQKWKRAVAAWLGGADGQAA